MRVPPSQPPLAPVYLDILQTRAARPPQAIAPSEAAPTRPAERVAPSAAAKLPRGSLVDIKA